MVYVTVKDVDEVARQVEENGDRYSFLPPISLTWAGSASSRLLRAQ
jgi:hypothetical protein